MYTKVIGGAILVIGDLHLSDRANTGRHRNYVAVCRAVMEDILAKVDEEKPSAVVFLGDLVGTSERNIRNREFLADIFKFFLAIKQRGCQLFCLRGNHDVGDFPDFNLFLACGLFETSESTGGFFDYFARETDTVPQARFHLVDYGYEKRDLDIADNCSNVVFAHNNFTIPGITVWYDCKDGYELASMKNFDGVALVIAGHIHNPSPGAFYSSRIFDSKSDEECALFYVGCPTRPTEAFKYDACYMLRFKYEDAGDGTGYTNYDCIEWVLPSSETVFYTDEELVDMRLIDDETDGVDRERLAEVLKDLQTGSVQGVDPMVQIETIPYASQEAKAVAKKYLQLAIDYQSGAGSV